MTWMLILNQIPVFNIRSARDCVYIVTLAEQYLTMECHVESEITS